MTDPKTCATCTHVFRHQDDAKYPRCRQSGDAEKADASLCGEMRKAGAACGPDAVLWEAAA